MIRNALSEPDRLRTRAVTGTDAGSTRAVLGGCLVLLAAIAGLATGLIMATGVVLR